MNNNNSPVASPIAAQHVRIAALVPDMIHGCDGPQDAFVILSRGADMVAAGKAPSDVANAMHDALQALGLNLISKSDHALGVVGY